MDKSSKTNTQVTLESIGLTENEALLYKTMIEHPQATVRELQSLTPFPRTQLYHILNSLKKHGLVTSAKEKARTRFIAEDPDALLDVLKQKEQQFNANAESLRALIPNLKNQYKGAQLGGSFKLFVGSEKYRRAYEDIINTKPKTVFTFSYTGEAPLPGVDIRKDVRAQMNMVGIEEKKIALPSGNDVELHLYAGKVLYTVPTDAEPVATLIEDKGLYSLHRNLFDITAKTV